MKNSLQQRIALHLVTLLQLFFSILSPKVGGIVFAILSRMAKKVGGQAIASQISFVFFFTDSEGWRLYLKALRLLIKTYGLRGAYLFPYYKFRFQLTADEPQPYFRFPLDTGDPFPSYDDIHYPAKVKAMLLGEYHECVSTMKPYRDESGHIHDSWLTLPLYLAGKRSDTTKYSFRETEKWLKGQPDVDYSMIIFSSLSSGGVIPIHSGGFNYFLRVHVPLVLPGAGSECTLTAGGQEKCWKEGEVLIFDDSYLHQVQNRTAEGRLIFMYAVWKRGITKKEKAVITFMLRCLATSEPIKKWVLDNA